MNTFDNLVKELDSASFVTIGRDQYPKDIITDFIVFHIRITKKSDSIPTYEIRRVVENTETGECVWVTPGMKVISNIQSVSVRYALMHLQDNDYFSGSDIKRLVEAGAVKVDGEKITDATTHIKNGQIVQVGKLKVFKLNTKGTQ